MRKPTYLSPSSISTFRKDRDEFYLKYLCDNPPPRFKQTQPMAAGSAFDAIVKSWLYKELNGNYGPEFEHRIQVEDGSEYRIIGPKFDPDLLFNSQVEPHNRDWARAAGAHLFLSYKRSGALADLLILLNKGARFELQVQSYVSSSLENVCGCVCSHCGRADLECDLCHGTGQVAVPLLGKPDIDLQLPDGFIIFDWKVNGYCSSRNTSPKKGYIKIRDGWDHKIWSASGNHGQAHKDAFLQTVRGFEINAMHYLEDIDKTWATQLAIYSWLGGAEVGSDILVGIEQLACDGRTTPPKVRVASHRCQIGCKFQTDLFAEICEIWKIIHYNEIFQDDDRFKNSDEIKEHIAKLDNTYKAFDSSGVLEGLEGPGEKAEKFFKDMTGR